MNERRRKAILKKVIAQRGFDDENVDFDALLGVCMSYRHETNTPQEEKERITLENIDTFADRLEKLSEQEDVESIRRNLKSIVYLMRGENLK